MEFFIIIILKMRLNSFAIGNEWSNYKTSKEKKISFQVLQTC